MTKLLNKLIDEGMIERIPGEKDRRIININLTEKGSTYLKSSFLEIQSSLKDKISSLPDEKLDKLSDTDGYDIKRYREEHHSLEKAKEVLAKGADSAAPAFAITISTGPAAANSACTLASSVTSAAIPRIALCWTATCSKASNRRPVIITSAPAFAKASAIFAPTPEPPPVINTRLPAKLGVLMRESYP